MTIATTDDPPPDEGRIVDRRRLFGLALSRETMLGALAMAGGAVVLASCDLADAPFDRDLHLLRRLTYGPTQADLGALNALGEAAWLAGQLDPSTLDTTAIDAKLAALPALAMTPAQLDAAYPDGGDAQLAGAQLKLAFAIRAVESPAQLYERMVEFWSDHFNVPTAERIQTLLKIVEDREVIRVHALGRFKDLLVASASSPAMLAYLDNFLSTAGAINENYARELLELHTVGVDNGYDQDDIVDTARLLTGWGIDRSTGEFEFTQPDHDAGPVDIMGWTRPGNPSGYDDGVAFLHWLADDPRTAEFVCTKIARRFVADAPDPTVVAAMTTAWLANDTQIVPVLEAMIAHPAFDAAAGTKFQRPLDYFASFLRSFDASVAPSTDVADLSGLGQVLGALGQIPFEWPAPNGYPDVGGAWLNTGALLNRWNLIGDVLANTFPVISYDSTGFRATLNGLTAAQIYEATTQSILHQSITGAGTVLLNSFTGWSDSDLPSTTEINEHLPLIAFAVFASADALYR